MYMEAALNPPDDGTRALAGVVEEVLAADAELAAADARRTRALAAAGHLALDVMAGRRSSSRAAEVALREVASEIAAAERLSDRTVQAQIGRAMVLVDDYPKTVSAWEAGAMSRPHVQAILDAGTVVPPEKRGEFDALAVETAAADGASPGRLRTRLAALAEALQPTTLTERHRRGRETRCVRVVTGEDGMSDLIATLPTVLAVGIYDRLTQQSRAVIDARTGGGGGRGGVARGGIADGDATDGGLLGGGGAGGGIASGGVTSGGAAGWVGAGSVGDVRGEGAADTVSGEGAAGRSAAPRGSAVDASPADTRTADQVRADLLADLLLTATPGADPTRTDDGPGTLGTIRARVQVVVPALTMLVPGRENLDPAMLVGHGPVDADTARHLTEATVIPWDRVITHPITGSILHTDTYHRTVAIDRHLRARDRHCRWPGCTAPAVRCEVDHTHDHALGGPTAAHNLAHLCQRHHTQKQFTRWKVRQVPGGILEFISPTGRKYTDHPLPYSPVVRFLPDDTPPPGSTAPGHDTPPPRDAAPPSG